MKLHLSDAAVLSVYGFFLLVLIIILCFQIRKGSVVKKKLQKELLIKQEAEEYDAKKALTNS